MAAKRTALGLTLEKGAREILAHVKGEARRPVRRARQDAGVSQSGRQIDQSDVALLKNKE